MRFTSSKKQIHLFLIFLIWLCCAFFVNPIGEFPLNDDWAYAKNVFHLSENGDLVFDDWPAMTLIVHMLWGAMFTSIFGFSFTVLRISILILGLAGVWGFYLLILKISRNNILALLGSFTLAFNPLYFSLSNTFMTDVSFLILIIWSLYFYLSYIEKPELKNLFLATLFVLLATLIRQLGVWIAISFVISQCIFFKSNGKQFIKITAFSIIPLIILAIYPYWLKSVDSIPSHYSSVKDLFHSGTITWVLQNFIQRSGVLLFSFGLFLLPVSLLIFLVVWKKMNKSHRFNAGLLSLVALYPVLMNLKYVPAGNVFYNHGLGPKILKDTYWGLNFRPVMFDGFQWFFNGLGIIGTILLVYVIYIGFVELFSKKETGLIRETKTFLLIIFSGYLGFVLIGTHFFDRYFLTIFPFILLFILPSDWLESRKIKIVGFVVLLPFMFFSTTATKDYLSWNKARWVGLNELMESGIPPTKIDGGFEFNAWYNTGEMLFAQPGLKSWYFVDEDEYAVTFGNVCGYEIYKDYTFFSYLTFQTDSIFILKKSPILDSIRIYSDLENVTVSKDNFYSTDSSFLFSNAETKTDNYSMSGKYSVELNKERPLGLGTLIEDVTLCEEWQVSVWSKNSQSGARLVVICPEVESYYWVSKFDGKEKDGWISAEINFIVPDQFPSNSLKIYVWNPDEEASYFDDIEIIRYYR